MNMGRFCLTNCIIRVARLHAGVLVYLVWCFAFWVCNAGLDWRAGSFLHGTSARCFREDLDDFSFHLGSRFLTCGVHARHVGYRFEIVLPLVDYVVHPSKYIPSTSFACAWCDAVAPGHCEDCDVHPADGLPGLHSFWMSLSPDYGWSVNGAPLAGQQMALFEPFVDVGFCPVLPSTSLAALHSFVPRIVARGHCGEYDERPADSFLGSYSPWMSSSDWRWSVNGALFAGSPRLQVRRVGTTQEMGHVEPFVDVDLYSVLRCIHALPNRDAWGAFRAPPEDEGFAIQISVDSLCLMCHLWGLQAPLLGCAVRWGEAGNPGPGSSPAASQSSILRIGTANVTHLKGREDEVKSLGPGIWALTETSSRANEIAAHRAFFKKHKLWYHPSAPCQPRTKREIACGSVRGGGELTPYAGVA